MKKLQMTALAIALAAAASQASAFNLVFNDNWGFNSTGAGLATALQPIDEMTYLGVSYTESTGTSAGSTFKDVGRIGATGFQNDASVIPAGVSGLGVSYELSATFLDWTGTYGATVGSNTTFSFDAGGTLTIFKDIVPLDNTNFLGAGDGTPIMTLSILVGTGNINFGNPAGLDGNIDILFNVDNVAAGYWFLDTNADGAPDTDVATLLANSTLTVGLTDSNNNIFTPSAAVAADFIATTGLGNPTGAGDIYTTNDGSFTLGTVPEPGTLALLGLGLLGLGMATRRRQA